MRTNGCSRSNSSPSSRPPAAARGRAQFRVLVLPEELHDIVGCDEARAESPNVAALRTVFKMKRVFERVTRVWETDGQTMDNLLVVYVGCLCAFTIVAIAMSITYIVALDQASKFEDARCTVASSTVTTRSSDCTCNCPVRVHDYNCDDSSSSSSKLQEMRVEQFCYNSCTGSCCKDSNCNLRHTSATPEWYVAVAFDYDTCPDSFFATIRGSRQCTQARGSGQTEASLSDAAYNAATRKLDEHRVSTVLGSASG